MIPEFVGRIPVIVAVESLCEDTLIRIMTEPRNAVIKQYQHLFKMDNVDLEINDDAKREVAKMAQEQKTGARGLKGILDKALLQSMFETPRSDIVGVYVDKDTIRGTSEAHYIRAPPPHNDVVEDVVVEASNS